MTRAKKTTGATVPPTAFDHWAAAGFKEDLLPIIPVNANMSAQSTVSPDNRGKVPGLPVGNDWGGFKDWQRVTATDEHIGYWARLAREKGAGTGLQARRWPGVDIDVTDEAVSDTLASLARFLLGDAPERVGRAPKRLLAYALAPGETIRKRRIEFTLPATGAEKHAVEVLGDGQQYVVAGVHPKTQRPYAWDRAFRTTDLLPITAAQVDAYIEQVAQTVAALGGAVIDRRAQGGGGEAPADQSSLRGDPALVAEALRVAGNDFAYDEWVKMVAAIKAALGGDEANYPIYETWCLSYPGNDARMARRKWDSVRPPFRVGANYVFGAAEAKGWTGRVAAAGFAPVPGATASVASSTDDLSGDPNLPYWVRDWVYALAQERFVRLSDRYVLSERQFARLTATPAIGVEHKSNPAKAFFGHPQRRVVNGMTYLPGGASLPVVDGEKCVNIWSPSAVDGPARARALTVQDADVAPWLDHMAKLIPDPVARATVLDWMAFVTQYPDDKPNWAVFLGGDQGIGKDLAVLPLIRAAGQRNTRIVQPGELNSEYTDWIANRRLVIVEEMRNFETKSVMNKLKMYITRPPETVPVHLKFMAIYETPNVAAFLFMSNFRDALALEKGDRRYFVYWSPMVPEPPAYYDALANFVLGTGGDEVVAWLHARPLPAFDAHGRAPDTADKAMMAQSGLMDFEQVVVDMVEAGAAPFDAPVCTLQTLWQALPSDLKRLPGAGFKRLSGALRIAGGGPVLGQDGTPRRILLDDPNERPHYGKAQLWAIRDPDMASLATDDALKTAFRTAWVAASGAGFTPQP